MRNGFYYRWSVVDLSTAIWKISTRLLKWSVGSIAVGVVLVLTSPPLIEGIGLQWIIWGAVDAVISLSGLRRAQRISIATPDEDHMIADALRLRRLLVVNAKLDVLYILVGVGICVVFRTDPFLLGNGVGILVQSFFLLAFDLTSARMLPRRSPPWYDGA